MSRQKNGRIQLLKVFDRALRVRCGASGKMKPSNNRIKTHRAIETIDCMPRAVDDTCMTAACEQNKSPV
jgi:hypothetical protein